MATITAQSTRSSGRVSNYAKKGYVAISAIGAPVATFEEHLRANRKAHGKDGVAAVPMVGEDGKPVRDNNGDPIPARNAAGKIIYQSRYVQAYPLVQSFGRDELDPDDPESWTKAQQYGRAVVHDQFPGHMALIATEVSGRSGCVHNHIVLDAINAETGKSLDSNRVTHARLAIAHDRILSEHGFNQRGDMARAAAEAQERMSTAADAVREHYKDKGLTESQLQRKITAAENRVRLGRTSELDPAQQREQRRLREYERYVLGQRTRQVQLEMGLQPDAEKFSEIVLASRIKESLTDPRARTWEDLESIGREHGVTITRRGKDVSYGMVLADAAGDTGEPSPAHRRRGTNLGDGYRVADVDAQLERNAKAAAEQVAHQRIDPDHAAGQQAPASEQSGPVSGNKSEGTSHRAEAATSAQPAAQHERRQPSGGQGPATPRVGKRRRERAVRRDSFSDEQRRGVELIAVVRDERDGGALVDFQLAAHDPSAKGRTGLHLYAEEVCLKQKDGSERTLDRTAQRISAQDYERLKSAAGNNWTEVAGSKRPMPVYAFAADITPSVRVAGYAPRLNTARPSSAEPIGPNVMQRQRASENAGREDKTKRREAAAAASKQEERDAFDRAQTQEQGEELSR